MKKKKISDIINSFESFEQLRGMGLLFNKNSKSFGLSGFVTAALLDFEEQDGCKITVLAIDTKHLNGWVTLKLKKEQLIELLNDCIEFVGKNEEESFILDKE